MIPMARFIKVYSPILVFSVLLAFFISSPHYSQNVSSLRQLGQAFSGMLTATVSINPLFVTIIPPADAEISKPFSIDVKVENRGDAKIEELKARIYLPDGLFLVGKDAEKNAGVLHGEKEKTVSFRVRAEAVGSYIVSVSSVGMVASTNDMIYSDDTAVIEVRSQGQPKRLNLFTLLSSYLQTILNML